MIEVHKHKGTDSPRINIEDIEGSRIRGDKQERPSMIQRNTYSLSGGVKFVAFTQAYNSTTGLVVVLSSRTTNSQFLDSMATSGFTVSGSGTDSGTYIALGYE